MASALVLAALCLCQAPSAFRPSAEIEGQLTNEDDEVTVKSPAQLQGALAETGAVRSGGLLPSLPSQLASKLEVIKKPSAEIEGQLADEDARVRFNSLAQLQRAGPETGAFGSGGPPLPSVPDHLKSNLTVIERFGDPGAFGVAYKCKVDCAKERECRDVALKVLRENNAQEFRKEAAILKYLKGKSSYVLSLVGAYKQGCGGKDCVITELFNKGDLLNVLNKKIPPLGQTAIYYWQVASGLADMHKNKIVHRDIKLENILVNCNENGTCCYASHIDFGLSELVEGDENNRGICGSGPYMAPEMFDDKVNAAGIAANDIWSMGVLMHVMFLHHMPSFTPKGPEGDSEEEQRKAFRGIVAKMRSFNVSEDPVVRNFRLRATPETLAVSRKVVHILAKILNFPVNYTQRIDADGLLKEAEELLKIAVSEEEFNRVTTLAPASYGAKKPVPTCLGEEASIDLAGLKRELKGENEELAPKAPVHMLANFRKACLSCFQGLLPKPQ